MVPEKLKTWFTTNSSEKEKVGDHETNSKLCKLVSLIASKVFLWSNCSVLIPELNFRTLLWVCENPCVREKRNSVEIILRIRQSKTKF